MITLLAPESGRTYSGGYLYNERVTAAAEPDRLTYRTIPGSSPPPDGLQEHSVETDSALLLDSLFFHDPHWTVDTARKRQAPVALLVHYLPSLDPTLPPKEARKLRQAEAACIQACAGIVTTSEYMHHQLRRIFETTVPLCVARPGLEAAIPDRNYRLRGRFSIDQVHWKSSRVELLTISNWTPAKNHRFLLKVLKEVENQKWHWRIYGSASEHGEIEELFLHNARQLQLESRIEIGPQINPVRVREEMRDADIFLFPSLFESYGMVAAEALGAGLPLIAHRTGGLPEVIGNSKAAVLCTPGHTGQWVRELRRLLRSPARRVRMHRAALSRARMLPEWNTIAERLCRFMEDL